MANLNLKVALDRNEMPRNLCLLRSCAHLNWLAITRGLPSNANGYILQYAYPELPNEIWNSEGFRLPQPEIV